MLLGTEGKVIFVIKGRRWAELVDGCKAELVREELGF